MCKDEQVACSCELVHADAIKQENKQITKAHPLGNVYTQLSLLKKREESIA